MLSFGIERWDAWTTGVRDKSDWNAFLAGSSQPVPAEPSVDYRYLKPRQRRRLSDISKMTLDVAFGAMDSLQIPTVFASRRGEIERMAGLLTDICRGEEASPTAFSLSVHNTTSGLFSIQSGNQAPSTAIAAGCDTVAAAFFEACCQIVRGQEQVLLVISEDAMPEVYQPFAVDGEQPVAAAFLLNASEQFVLEPDFSPEVSGKTCTSGQVFDCLKLITAGQEAILSGERMPCRIRVA